MSYQFPHQSSNTTLLKGLCGILPAALLAAAHWFPWSQKLGRLQSYAIGTGAIVGTAGLAIALSNGDRDDHVTMLMIAAASAGGITVAAHEIDDRIGQRGRIANLEAQINALKQHGDL